MKPLIAIVLACALALGALLLFLRGSAASPPGTQPAILRDDPAGLRAAIEALTAEVAALREERVQPALRAPSPVREAVDDPELVELAQQLQRLVALLEALPQALRERQGQAVALPMRLDERLALLERGPDLQALQRVADMPQIRRDMEHLGWTVREVLERYGAPARLSASDGILHLSYESEGPNLTFQLVDGAVFHVLD